MNAFRNTAVYKANAIRDGANIIRALLTTRDCSKGLTTAELYQLAIRAPPPPNYQGDPRFSSEKVGNRKDITLPPHNDHPVRSKAFLKRSILPTLEQAKELVKVVTEREAITPVPARGKKGKILAHSTKETSKASASNPIPIKVWVWKPLDPSAKISAKKAEVPSQPFGAAVGAKEDWSHLNKRRQGSRQEKIRRDVATMKRLQAQERQQATS